MLALLLTVSLTASLVAYIAGKKEGFTRGYSRGVNWARINDESGELLATYRMMIARMELQMTKEERLEMEKSDKEIRNGIK